MQILLNRMANHHRASALLNTVRVGDYAYVSATFLRVFLDNFPHFVWTKINLKVMTMKIRPP